MSEVTDCPFCYASGGVAIDIGHDCEGVEMCARVYCAICKRTTDTLYDEDAWGDIRFHARQMHKANGEELGRYFGIEQKEGE